MNKTTKLFPVLVLLLAFSALADDAAFRSPEYIASSNEPLSREEKTVEYTYPANPCGTLMTQFSASGSVSLGRGPVYQLMLRQCQEEDSNSYPDDNSVRTFACQNIASHKRILGNATFAFQCKEGQGQKVRQTTLEFVKVPLNRIPRNLH